MGPYRQPSVSALKDVVAKQHNLSDRQALALSHILVHGRVSIQDFERLSPRVSRRTLQRDLKAMVGKGLIIEKASNPTDPTKIYILAGKLSG
ncbi:MAG: winged helix-turn-helix transcriptional regulator [Desulfobacterales bacterium]